MKREWKPGDVALASWQQFTPARAMFSAARGAWIDIDGAEFDGDEDELTLRPLVVIDPEDREQVERLLFDYDERRGIRAPRAASNERVDSLQAALREFANPTPPKPDEPQGLGAVVEDDDKTIWVRMDDGCWASHHEHRVDYAEIAAVRVLSEGVTSC